jgi:hypothetical protein
MSHRTELALIEACAEIGGIPEMSAWATSSLATRIDEAGRRVEDLTIGELLTMLRAQRATHRGGFVPADPVHRDLPAILRRQAGV